MTRPSNNKFGYCKNIATTLALLFVFSVISVAQEGFNEQERMRARTCQRIFDELKQAQGLRSFDPPHLKMVVSLKPEKFKIAVVNTESGEIQYDRVSMNIAFKLMESDSLNAVSFVLSHEIAHYMRKHQLVHKFIEKSVGLTTQANTIASAISQNTMGRDSIIQKQMESLQIRKNEAEADLDAGFHSYLAGYNTKLAGVKYLDITHVELKIDSLSENYISLSKRKEIIRNTGARLDTIIRVFELANYLQMIGHYQNAELCYKYVSKDIRSAEVLNNIGVNKLKRYLESSIAQIEFNYKYPLIIENLPRIDVQFGPSFEVTHKNIKLWHQTFTQRVHDLNESIGYLEAAHDLNPKNFVTALNLASSYSILVQLQNSLPYMIYQSRSDPDAKIILDSIILAENNQDYLKYETFFDDYCNKARSYSSSARSELTLKMKSSVDVQDSLNLSNIYSVMAIISEQLEDTVATKNWAEQAIFFNKSNIYLDQLWSLDRNIGARHSESVSSSIFDQFTTTILDSRLLDTENRNLPCPFLETKISDQSIATMQNSSESWDIDFELSANTLNLSNSNEIRLKYKKLENAVLYQFIIENDESQFNQTINFTKSEKLGLISNDETDFCSGVFPENAHEIYKKYNQYQFENNTATRKGFRNYVDVHNLSNGYYLHIPADNQFRTNSKNFGTIYQMNHLNQTTAWISYNITKN